MSGKDAAGSGARPRVYVIGTGGSISCIGESRIDFLDYNYADEHLTIDEMIARIPEAASLAEVRAEQFLNVYGGGVSPAKWLELAQRINSIFREDPAASGVVVTHGTSTLEETAYFLNLTVKSRKPVVVTGAMRPPTAMSTDTDVNLYDAIRVAAHPHAVGKGVLVVLNNDILTARDAVKTSTSRLDTFKSNDLGFLGYADADGDVVFYRAPTRAHTTECDFDVDRIPQLPRVDIASAYSGVDGVAIDAFVKAGAAGIVGAGLGSGSAPATFLAALTAACERGVVVVMSSQSTSGRVMRKRAFTKRGFLVADNLGPKKARILLMLALAEKRSRADIERMLATYEGYPVATTLDEFQFFLEKEWSDGFPVVTPTEERVRWMLEGTRCDPEEVVGHIPPAGEVATVRDIAIHALMAGCRPDYLPVVLGAMRLMLREEFNMGGVQCTMHGVAPLMIVNGPYAKKIGLHGGNGCFGPGFRANATIGRAIRLLLMNLGAGLAGKASATVFSSPIRYTACLTENVEHTPWETLAVSRGYAPDDNVITCAMVESPRLHFDDVSTEPERLLRGIADSMTSAGSWNMWFSSDVVAAMSPQHARLCADAGLSHADAQQRLWELAERPQGNLKRGGNWRPERARAMGIDPDDDDYPIKAVKDPNRLHLIVAGGLGPITAVCHGWNESSRAVHGKYEV